MQKCDVLWEKNSSNKFRDILNAVNNYTIEKLKQNHSVYLRKKHVEQHDLYVPPLESAIGTHWEMQKLQFSTETVPRLLPSKTHFIPITSTVRSLFSNQEFKNMYMQHNSQLERSTCEDGHYRNFCSGNVYKTSSFFQQYPNALQIQLATDGFEVCNPIGSKATIHSMCPIYFSIKNLPIQYTSKISNIYLAALCRTDDIKTLETDFNDLWQLIVRDISILEQEGIKIDDNTMIRGTVVYFAHDNLGANCAIGMVESFGTTHFCRFCKSSKKDTETMCRENSTMIRTIVDYEKSLKIIEQSTKVDYKQTQGIKRPCVLNELQYFHILRNVSVDIMHDLNEGAIPFLLKQVFSYCITEKLFNEDQLKKMIQFHDFSFNKKNSPSTLNMSKHNLNQSATQIMCLFQHIGFIFYKFQNDLRLEIVWKYMHVLQTIVQIAYSNEIEESDLAELTTSTYVLLQGI